MDKVRKCEDYRVRRGVRASGILDLQEECGDEDLAAEKVQAPVLHNKSNKRISEEATNPPKEGRVDENPAGVKQECSDEELEETESAIFGADEIDDEEVADGECQICDDDCDGEQEEEEEE